MTAAETLQWISDPDRAIEQTKKAVKPGGRNGIPDYNRALDGNRTHLRISIAFSGPCYTGEQQIIETTGWQHTFQNSSIFGAIDPGGDSPLL